MLEIEPSSSRIFGIQVNMLVGLVQCNCLNRSSILVGLGILRVNNSSIKIWAGPHLFVSNLCKTKENHVCSSGMDKEIETT